ncbi:MAG: transglutaminase domain-containing protein, partial [Euryarchaeota archaeon]|nr:transglutaminase domain-containing protein [Euryarchaeota archaeon]
MSTNKKLDRLVEIIRKISLLFLIVLLIDVGSTIPYYYLYAKKHGPDKISETANKIVEGINDDEQKVRALMKWVNSNMESSYLAIFISKYPFINIFRPDDPNWTIFTMYGGCEEYADLFVALANSINISARTVHNSGEDHVWAEVYIDGKWMHADPSIAPNGLLNDPGIYERKRENGGWGKNI